MNKQEFLQQLEAGLKNAAPDERVAAMQFYTEYLDEAGPEHEAEVLAELGDPKKLAEEILGAPSGESAPGEGWTPPTPPPKLTHGQPFNVPPPPPTANPFDPAAPKAPTPPPFAASADPDFAGAGANQSAPLPVPVPPAPRYNENANNILKIVVAVLVIIVLAPLLGGLLGGLGGLLVAAIVLFLVPFIVGISFVASGIAVIVAGGVVMAASLANGFLLLGTGILLLGLGLLACVGGSTLIGKTLPAIFRWVVGGIKYLWGKLTGFFKGNREEQNNG